MQMPGMDGEALGRVVKARRRLADTPWCMMTSLGGAQDDAGAARRRDSPAI